MTAVIGAAMAGLLISVGAAHAGSYTFRVDHVDRHPRVTWTQPASYPDVYIDWIEVATSTATASDGHFFNETIVDSEVYFSAAESTGVWLSAYQLGPGTYYVHLRALRESDYATAWSSIATLIIPQPPQPPEPKRKPWIESFSGRISRTDTVASRPWWRIRVTVCATNWPEPVRLTVTDYFWRTGSRWQTQYFEIRAPIGFGRLDGCRTRTITKRSIYVWKHGWTYAVGVRADTTTTFTRERMVRWRIDVR